MREIKFRAWNTIKMIPLSPYDRPDLDHPLTDLVEEENWHVMQYTGLKDKNGVEIYEGDILRRYDGEVGEVAWSRDDASFEVLYLQSWGAQGEGWEVIGNIYENPDLIE